MDQMTISVKQIRWLIIIGTALLGGFMVPDLMILPSALHDTYIMHRVGLQFPVCVLFLISTFLPSFQKIYQPILFMCMLLITYINFALILRCWQFGQFAFSYEGTIMYSLFSLFIFRLNFKFGLPFAFIILLGFGLLLMNYPIYGEKNGINLGFVFIGLVVGLLGVYRLESAWKENRDKNEQLVHLSQTDPLTDILNRGTYEARFEEKLELSKRHGNTVCVYFIDLDYFKDYNDGYGHQQGDKIIQMQANMLKEIFQRSTDIVARYGGEEFVVVTSSISEEQSKVFAHQIIEKWRVKKVSHNKGQAGEYMSCSVGFYIEEANAETTIMELVKKADDALYLAKAKGRNCMVRFL